MLEAIAMTELTELQGVGPARSERMVEAGYDDMEAVANADPAELAEAIEVPEDTALGFVVEAENYVASEEADIETRDAGDEPESLTEEIAEATDGSESDSESVVEEDEEVPSDDSEDAEESDTDASDDSETEPMVELTFEFNSHLEHDTFHAAMMRHRETMIRGNRSNYEAFEIILDGLRETDGAGFTCEIEKKELNEVHNANRKLITSYQGDNLIDHMDALKEVQNQVDSMRSKYLF